MRDYTSSLSPLMYEYVAFKQASGRWNESSYAVNLSLFDKYCKTNFPNSEQLTQEMVDGWCARRDTENNNSCRSRIYVIVSFVRYLQKRVLTDVRMPVVPRKEPRTYIPHAFTHNELMNFFNACDSIPAPWGTEEQVSRRITVPVFFRLLYSSGIRINEARLLRKSNVDLEHGVLNIEYSKGHPQHFIVLHDSMLQLIRKYDNAAGMLYPDRIYFFPARNGRFHTEKWVPTNFNKMWGRDNSSYATAYALRHNYAIENINSWTDDGFDFNDKLLYLSKSMGHSVIESTKYYYALVPRLANVLASHTDESETIPEVHYESH